MKDFVVRTILLFALLSALPAAWAQGLGSISGAVSDPSGAVIPSAKVTATQNATGTTTVVDTNSSGIFVFPSLLPATYSISIAATGFSSFTEKDLVLQANQSLTVNATLQVGTASQVVSVNANSVQVDTSSSTLSQVIDRAQVNDLPLNGRNAAQLTTLVAGVVATPNDGTDAGNTKTFPVAVEISANGSLAGQTTYLLDGADNLDSYTDANQPMPFPDALQEFSFQASDYAAQYGQSAGGVVNVVTKSGGSSFHGDAFEYWRNGALNARNYFASSVDPLKRNQFGGTVGGPVIIPHFVSGKSTFFFVGYQGTVSHDQVGGQSAFLPTQANLQGDFSAMLSASNPDNPLRKAVQIDNPFTGQAFKGDIIPTTDFDPAALAVTKDLPAVTGDGQIVYAQPTNENFQEVLARVDQTFNQHDRGFAHYYTNTFKLAGSLNPANLVTYLDQSNIHFQSAVVSETHIFTPNLLNDLTVGYSREISIRGPLPGAPDAASFGVKIWQPTQTAIEGFDVSGFFNIGANPQGTFQRNNYTLADNFHWVKGSHNLGFGAAIELSKNDVNSILYAPGLFNFNSTNSNYALASFLLGYMSAFQQGSGQISNDRDQFYGFYGQDSWKMNPRFTLNYGLRWEPFLPWQEVHHRLMQFNPAAYAAGTRSSIYVNAPAGLLFPGDPGVPEQGVRNNYNDLMPRVGFAWDVFGNGKTSLRGGGGVFYQTRQDANSNQKSSQITPYSVSVSLTFPAGPFSNPYKGITNPFPAPFPPPANIAFQAPVQAYTYEPSGNFQVPVTYTWNLTQEQQITPTLLARISYVGSHSSHLYAAEELNPATYIPGSTLSTNQRRRYQGFTTITQTSTVGNDNYNALQATLQQRVTNGLSVTANYAWSHSINNLPLESEITDQATGQSYVYPVYFPNFKSLDIGPPDFDRANVFSGSYIWTLPKLAEGNRALRAVINGWQTTGIAAVQSGEPLTITAGADISKTNLNEDRAQYSGGNVYGPGACKPNSACKNYIVPSVFSLPATGTFGNVVKGSFRGPGYFDWDAGLIRSFALKEKTSLDFRAEYFNILNRANFLNPVSSVSGADFGGITSADDPRIAQLSLKLLF
ncbi:MAG TPA: carboxypeptidase regulatory-like domain-containing protein [Acidobacteriaceae bacterium]|nr:carboxypeptidase regulatory-like domain-containing protein [Acidobacteriaceae bacterium]